MVKLKKGKSYKIVSLHTKDAYYDDFDIIKDDIFLYLGEDRFESDNFGYCTLLPGYKVEEYGDVPTIEAEAATMELEEQELDFSKIKLGGVLSSQIEPLTSTELGYISGFNSAAKRQFETGSVRDNNQGKPFVHNLLGYTRLRFGYHMSKNASKYGENNFLLGIPTKVALESLDRHLAQYLAGDRSEDHLSAILFGVQLVMMNEEKEGITANHFVK